MRIFRDPTELTNEARSAVIAIGNFDGVHPGHQEVIRLARQQARVMDAPLGVVTFEPHPRQYFQPDAAAFRLTPLPAKARHLGEMGVALLYVLTFDQDLASKVAEDFVSDILVQRLGVRHVVAGHDFRFGHKRGGDMELLTRLGHEHGFGVTTVEPVAGQDGTRYASSTIRQRLAAGDVARAAAMLGRPWEVGGAVQHGDQRGRSWGFPTLNLTLGEHIRPAYGIYAVRVGVALEGSIADDPVRQSWSWYNGVASLGTRATVDGTQELLETHVLDFEGDVYDRDIRIAFVDTVRLGDTAFESVEALKAQIAQDCRDARAILAPRR